jgi:AraC-like DNA-binding protein
MKVYRELSIQAKLWMSYLLVFIIPIFLTSTIGYYWLERNINQKLLQRHTASLKDIIKTIDENFVQLDSVQTQLAQTLWVNKLVNMQGDDFDRNRVNAYDLMEYRQFVYACQQSLPGASFLGIYFPRKNYVISSSMNGTLDFLLYDAMSVRSITKDIVDEKIAGLKEKETVYFISDEIYQYGKRESGIFVLKSILKLPDIPSPGAVLISYISTDRFLRAVEAELTSDGFLSLIINGDNGRIFYSGAEKGDKAFFLIMNSSVTGWNYELTVSKSELLHEITLVRNIILLIVFGTLMVCLLISGIFTIRIYRPIKETLELLAINTIYEGDELKLIKSDIIGLLKQRDELQKMLQGQTPMLFSYYYIQLLLGPKEEHDQAAGELLKIITNNYLFFRVCIFLQKTPSGIALSIKPALQIQSLLDHSDSVRVYAINQNSRTLLIVRYDHEEDFALWLNDAHTQFPDAFIACGYAVDFLKNLSDSFADACRICDFRLVKSGSCYRDAENEHQNFYLPFELELDLIIALRTKNHEKSEVLVRKIMDANKEGKVALNRLYRVLESIQYSEYGDNPHSIHSGNLDNLSEEMIFALVNNICTFSGTISKRLMDPSLLIELVDSLIQNPNISLEYIADRFDVSVSLVSKEFKNTVGTGFNKYIINKRIEMAKGFLSDGYDVISVAKMVGFTNDTTFRRCFKSSTGSSPSAYRQQHLED